MVKLFTCNMYKQMQGQGCFESRLDLMSIKSDSRDELALHDDDPEIKALCLSVETGSYMYVRHGAN